MTYVTGQFLVGLCSIHIYFDLNNFWYEAIKNKMAAQPFKKITWWGWGAFFSHFFFFIYYYSGVVYPSLEKFLGALFSGKGGGGGFNFCTFIFYF